MVNNKYKIETPFYALAPMANISTYPFASQCARFGADLVWTPMVHTDTILNNWPEAKKILDFECHPELACSEPAEPGSGFKIPDQVRNDRGEGIENYIVQIVGSDPEKFVKSVKIIEKKLNPLGIDLNFGCPDKNIIKSGCGGAMLKDNDRIVEIVRAVKNAAKLPVSVKTRSGWDNPKEIFDLAPRLEKEGISMLTVHPRTVKQGFRGNADWNVIKTLKSRFKDQNSKLILVGSGDITTWRKAIERQRETGCDGVMIGRSALGRPWIFTEIIEKRGYEPTISEIKKLVLEISESSYAIWGEKGIREARKHFACYFRGFLGANRYRKALMEAATLKEIQQILETAEGSRSVHQ